MTFPLVTPQIISRQTFKGHSSLIASLLIQLIHWVFQSSADALIITAVGSSLLFASRGQNQEAGVDPRRKLSCKTGSEWGTLAPEVFPLPSR